jgi:hypothetical protein
MQSTTRGIGVKHLVGGGRSTGAIGGELLLLLIVMGIFPELTPQRGDLVRGPGSRESWEVIFVEIGELFFSGLGTHNSRVRVPTRLLDREAIGVILDPTLSSGGGPRESVVQIHLLRRSIPVQPIIPRASGGELVGVELIGSRRSVGCRC